MRLVLGTPQLVQRPRPFPFWKTHGFSLGMQNGGRRVIAAAPAFGLMVIAAR